MRGIEQAVSTSIVYLVRSLGTVWGVAATSTIIQNVLTTRLPLALAGIPDKEKVIRNVFLKWSRLGSLTTLCQIIDEIRHSVTAIRHLDPEVQSIARHVYFEALRYGFGASAIAGAVALVSAFFAKGRSLDRN
jgi:hypothetical protein